MANGRSSSSTSKHQSSSPSHLSSIPASVRNLLSAKQQAALELALHSTVTNRQAENLSSTYELSREELEEEDLDPTANDPEDGEDADLNSGDIDKTPGACHYLTCTVVTLSSSSLRCRKSPFIHCISCRESRERYRRRRRGYSAVRQATILRGIANLMIQSRPQLTYPLSGCSKQIFPSPGYREVHSR